MARQQFPNLTIIDEEDIADRDIGSLANSLIAFVPDLIATAVDRYIITEAVQQQFNAGITIEDISKCSQGYLLRIGAANIKTALLHKGSVKVGNYSLPFITLKKDYGSTAIPLKSILTSHPLNTHLGRPSAIHEPHERLIIEVSGMPPHLCSNEIIYQLFRDICLIRQIKHKPATLEYELVAHGQLSAVPDVAHLGLRGTGDQREIIKIWPLTYTTFTEEMLGRMTPPRERYSQNRGSSLLHPIKIHTHSPLMTI